MAQQASAHPFSQFCSEIRATLSKRNGYISSDPVTYSQSNQTRDSKFRKIKVELVNPETNEPLRVVDEKGKPIKYQIVAKTGYTAPREIE